MSSETEREARWDLLTAEDSYAAATAQNPATSRRVKSLIPTQAGLLERQLPKTLLGGEQDLAPEQAMHEAI